MARKNAKKNDSITFNSRTKAVMADVIHENIKEKVNAVREVVTGKSNNEIVLVLQYYDYDVEKAIQAYLEDGAKQALTEWHYSGPKPVKKKRNRKKGGAQDAPKSPESVSSESTTSTPGYLANGDIPRDMPTLNGLAHTEPEILTSQQLSINPATSSQVPASLPVMNGDLHTDTSSSSIINSNNSSSDSHVVSAADTVSSPQPQRQSHAHHRQRTHSGTHSGTHAEKKHLKADRDRTSSVSSVGDQTTVKKPPHHGLEKSSKDLHRQTVSLERLKLVFSEEVEKTYKKVKTVFDELRACLSAREAMLLREVDLLRDTGRDVFIMRQGLAADLKVKIDRADRMSETELADLRLEIKHFVADRKIDEDLGRTTRFLYDDDSMKNYITSFAEVVPVKCSYVQQCQHSVSPVISDQSPTSQSPASLSTQRSPTTQPTQSDVKQDQSSPSTSYLDDKQAHEVAELQRRLKSSLILEGIQVETYPERPASAPVSSTSPVKSARGRPASGAYRNRNRQSRDSQDRRRNGPNSDVRGSYEQTPGGERVILIGKSTRGAGGGSRPARGGRGRGGRGRGGNQGNQGPRPETQEVGRTGGSGEGSNRPPALEAPRDQRENSGSPRRGRGNRGGGNQRNRQNSPVKSANQPVNHSPTKPQTDTVATASSGAV